MVREQAIMRLSEYYDFHADRAIIRGVPCVQSRRAKCRSKLPNCRLQVTTNEPLWYFIDDQTLRDRRAVGYYIYRAVNIFWNNFNFPSCDYIYTLRSLRSIAADDQQQLDTN